MTAAPAALPLRAGWRDYLALTKPKVISLLLLTTLTAMFMAARGWPGLTLLLVVALAGYASAGSAGVFNMVIDRDIDLRMKRTAGRPTSSGLISMRDAAAFGAVLQLASFLALWVFASPLSAWLSLAGFLTYVLVYTLWLKRRTWHNIVLGGAAGCFPPLVGWAAVTGNLNLFAWFLFAIIFFWTPAHFWALALMIKEEYREVGIPMLPVVHGDRLTVAQVVAVQHLHRGAERAALDPARGELAVPGRGGAQRRLAAAAGLAAVQTGHGRAGGHPQDGGPAVPVQHALPGGAVSGRSAGPKSAVSPAQVCFPAQAAPLALKLDQRSSQTFFGPMQAGLF